MAIPSKFPVRVRRGSVTVKIYRQVREKAGRKYHSFTVDYTASGKRTLKAFADYEKAHEQSTGIASKLAQGEIEVLQLTGADRSAFGHALGHLNRQAFRWNSLLRSLQKPIEFS